MEKEKSNPKEYYNKNLQAKGKLFDEIYALFKETKQGNLCEFDFNDQIIEILCSYERSK